MGDNKPKNLATVQGYEWDPSEEDSDDSRKGYMTHLRQMLQIPSEFTLVDVQPEKQLLTVELMDKSEEISRKMSGTTDVAITTTADS